MKKIFQIVTVAMLLFTFSCNNNKKLSQENAEKGIRDYLMKEDKNSSAMEISDYKVEPISQFSENEATLKIGFSAVCTDPDGFKRGRNIVLLVKYKKNIDNKWVLVEFFNQKENGDGPFNHWFYDRRNPNIIVQ